MREYAQIRPSFWYGETGRKLRSLGAECHRISFYLLTAPSANHIGLYYLPLPTLSHETGCPLEGAYKALLRVCETGFCQYDAEEETVWVPEMAHYQIGDVLKPDDKRRNGVENEIEKFRKSRFFNDFIDKYAVAFGLRNERENTKPLTSPLQAPCKPLRSIETETETEREQEQEKEKKDAATPLPPLFPPEMRSPEFDAAWAAWVKHRKEIRHELKPSQLQSQAKTLTAWGRTRALAALEHTVFMGWQGLREPDAPHSGNGHPPQQREPARIKTPDC